MKKKYQSFLSENFQFLEVKFSIYLNGRVFVMRININTIDLLSPEFAKRAVKVKAT